jgi:hypothetical protein
MGLLQVATNTVTSAVASVTLTGIDSDNPYMVAMFNVAPAGDNKDLYLNYIKASDSSEDTTANYDFASKGLYASSTFQDNSQSNANNQKFKNKNLKYFADPILGVKNSNCIIYLYNTFSSSEFSYNTVEANGLNFSQQFYGEQGGGVHTVAQSNSGVKFQWESGGNFTSGTFTLYKVV